MSHRGKRSAREQRVHDIESLRSQPITLPQRTVNLLVQHVSTSTPSSPETPPASPPPAPAPVLQAIGLPPPPNILPPSTTATPVCRSAVTQLPLPVPPPTTNALPPRSWHECVSGTEFDLTIRRRYMSPGNNWMLRECVLCGKSARKMSLTSEGITWKHIGKKQRKN